MVTSLFIYYLSTNTLSHSPPSVYGWPRRTACRQFLGWVRSPWAEHLRSPWCSRGKQTSAAWSLLRSPGTTTWPNDRQCYLRSNNKSELMLMRRAKIHTLDVLRSLKLQKKLQNCYFFDFKVVQGHQCRSVAEIMHLKGLLKHDAFIVELLEPSGSKGTLLKPMLNGENFIYRLSWSISSNFGAVHSWIAEKITKNPIFGVKGCSRSSMLVSPERSSAVLVRSKSVSICNRSRFLIRNFVVNEHKQT